MQSKDALGNVLESRQLLDDEIAEQVATAIQGEKVKSVTVGKIPAKGEQVEINGLIYDVVFVDAMHGILKIRLKNWKANHERK